MLGLVLGLIVAASAPADAMWETYACTDGPTVKIALDGKRPATRGYVTVGAGVIELTPHKGEAKSVLRGQGYMVRPFNWTDLLYAPPGREKAAYQCRVVGAANRPGTPLVE